MMETTFQKNVVVITGASYGIGRQLALELASDGAWLVLASRNVEKLEDVSRLCSQQGGKAIVIPADVANAIECQNLIQCTIAEYGRIDTLINNANSREGGRYFQPAREISISHSRCLWTEQVCNGWFFRLSPN